MGFGKDESLKARIPGFRQRAMGQSTERFTRKSSGGGGGGFREKLILPLNNPTPFILIPGEYPYHEVVKKGGNEYDVIKKSYEYFCYDLHETAWNQGGKKIVRTANCSGGVFKDVKGKREKCVGCDEFWKDITSGKKKARISKRNMSAFTALHFAWYHKTEQRNGKGELVTNDEGKPYHNWEPCDGRGCENCRTNVEKEFGKRRHWSLGKGHWDVLINIYAKRIGESCKSCRTKNSIGPALAWICDTKKDGCGEPLIEMETTSYKDEEIDHLVSHTMRCSLCGVNEMPDEYISCNNCSDPVRADLFDVVMKGNRRQASGDTTQTALEIIDWDFPEDLGEEYLKLIKDLGRPMDLEKLFSPTPLEVQERHFLFGEGSQREPEEASRAYGGNTSYSR